MTLSCFGCHCRWANRNRILLSSPSSALQSKVAFPSMLCDCLRHFRSSRRLFLCFFHYSNQIKISLLIGLKWPLPNCAYNRWLVICGYWSFYEKPGCDQGYFLLLSAFSPFMIMTLSIMLFYTGFAGMALKH